jgi:co-chaperonin GroES (HSP10)
MQFRPLNDQVLIKVTDEPELRLPGSTLYIPGAKRDQHVIGEVVAIGPGRWLGGRRVAPVVKRGRLRATTDATPAVRESDATLIIVGTPVDSQKRPDMTQVARAAEAVAGGPDTSRKPAPAAARSAFAPLPAPPGPAVSPSARILTSPPLTGNPLTSMPASSLASSLQETSPVVRASSPPKPPPSSPSTSAPWTSSLLAAPSPFPVVVPPSAASTSTPPSACPSVLP